MDYTIRNETLKVRVSDLGAELQSVKSADGREYLWQADPEYWDEKAPNLFPYIGRLTKGCYVYNGETYEMPIHGFLMRQRLVLETQNRERLTLRLDAGEETKRFYPFDFIYRITYSLKGNTLAVTVTVDNIGEGRMYFAIGAHPGFQVPMEDGLKFEDYYLEFPLPSRPDQILLSDTCYITGTQREYPLECKRRIRLRHDLFDHDALILKHVPDTVKIASDKGTRSVILRYPHFPYLGIWHAVKKEAPYVCLEPWTSLPSRDGIIEDLACQADLIRLESGQRYINTWEIVFA